MARLALFVLVGVLAAGSLWYLLSRISGRPFVGDAAGKILLALTIAAVAFWLFGGGALVE